MMLKRHNSTKNRQRDIWADVFVSRIVYHSSIIPAGKVAVLFILTLFDPTQQKSKQDTKVLWCHLTPQYSSRQTNNNNIIMIIIIMEVLKEHKSNRAKMHVRYSYSDI